MHLQTHPKIPTRQPLSNSKKEFKTVFDSSLPSIHMTRQIPVDSNQQNKLNSEVQHSNSKSEDISSTVHTTQIEIPRLPLHESFRITVGGSQVSKRNQSNNSDNLNVMDQVVEALVKPQVCRRFEKS